MIVVSDTSPLNYLLLIQQEPILPALFGRVVTSPAVIAELVRPRAPSVVKVWAAAPPSWLEVRRPSSAIAAVGLGPGESEAIALAQELHAELLLIDERDAVKAARKLGLFVTGTLGVLEMAARRDLLMLQDAIDALHQTTFRMPAGLIGEILRNDARRRHGHQDTN